MYICIYMYVCMYVCMCVCPGPSIPELGRVRAEDHRAIPKCAGYTPRNHRPTPTCRADPETPRAHAHDISSTARPAHAGFLPGLTQSRLLDAPGELRRVLAIYERSRLHRSRLQRRILHSCSRSFPGLEPATSAYQGSNLTAHPRGVVCMYVCMYVCKDNIEG